MHFADQHILERDQALPGLRQLLDDASLQSWLREHGLGPAQRHYLRYKPGTSAVAKLERDGRPCFLLAVSDEALPKWQKTIDKAAPDSLLIVDRRRRLLLAGLGADRDLPALSRLAEHVGRLLPGAVLDQELAYRPLAYKPQRRWVGSVVLASGATAVVRCYRAGQSQDAAARVRALEQSAVVTPNLLATNNTAGLLAVEHLPGAHPGAAQWTAVGEALGRWHTNAGEAPVEPPPNPHHASAAQVIGLLPDLRSRLGDVIRRIDDGLIVQPPVHCHGDFSADQVVIGSDGGVGVIDLDRAGPGQPGDDLGSAISVGLPELSVSDFLAGYSKFRPLPPDLRFRVGRATVTRLGEPFRTAAPDWAATIERHLSQLENELS